MKQTKSGVNRNENKLQESLRKKLEGHETHVSSNLWASIENQLPQATGVSPTPSGSGWGIGQWLITAATVAGVTIGALYISSEKTNSPTLVETQINQPVEKEKTTPASEPKPSEQPAIDSTPKPLSEAQILSTDGGSDDIEKESEPTIFSEKNAPQLQNREHVYLGTIDERFDEEEAPVAHKAALNGRFTTVAANKENLLYLFIPEDGTEHSYEWNFGDDQTANSASPNHTYSEEGTYEVVLRITDIDGFVKESKQTICVYRPGKIKAPNAFSPGNDGKNDIFDLSDLSTNIASYIELSILDSNGRVIFTNNAEPTWNGLDLAGIQCQPGAYSFIAKATDHCGTPIVKAGPIQLFTR